MNYKSGNWGVRIAMALLVAGNPADAQSQVGARKQLAKQTEQIVADPRVAKALAEASLKASVNEAGNYELMFRLEDDRTQLVFVRSETSQWGAMEIREVYSYAYSSKTRLSQAKLEKLLKASAELKSGAWQLVEARDWMAILSVKVAADCDAEALDTVVRGVARTTDEVENEITGKDDH